MKYYQSLYLDINAKDSFGNIKSLDLTDPHGKHVNYQGGYICIKTASSFDEAKIAFINSHQKMGCVFEFTKQVGSFVETNRTYLTND